MIQFLLSVVRLFRQPCRLSEAESWRLDPLSHPALRAMSSHQLADLPIGHPVLPERLTDGRC